MNMIEKIKLLMNERGLTKADVSKGANIPYTTIDGLFKKGYENVRYPTLRKLANFFDVSMEYLVNDDITDRNYGKVNNINLYEAIPITEIVNIPIVGVVRAGLPILAVENIEGYIPLPKFILGSTDKEFFGLKVKGDSMNLEFTEGTILIIEKTEYIENGDIGIVLINGFEATVKKIVKNNNMITLIPMSNNPEYTPKMYDIVKDEIKIIGKVKHAIKSY